MPRPLPKPTPLHMVLIALLLAFLGATVLVRTGSQPYWQAKADAQALEQWYSQGMDAFAYHDWDTAIRAFDQVLNRQSDYKDAFRYRTESLYFKGVDSYEAGDYSSARELLTPMASYRDARLMLRTMAIHALQHDPRMQFLLEGPATEVRGMAMSADGHVLAVGGKTRFQVWDLERRQILFEAPLESDWSGAVALSSDGTLVAVASDHVTIYDITTGRELHRMDKLATDMVMSPDNQLLVTSFDWHEVTIWRMKDGSMLRVLNHESDIASLAFSPDGQWLATGEEDRFIYIWDTVTGTRLQTLESGNSKLSMTFSPDGKQIISGENSFLGLHIWDIASGQHVMEREGHGDILSIAFSPDGSMLMTGNQDQSVQLIQPHDLQVITSLPAHGSPVIGARMTPDQHQLIAVTQDGLIVVWDVSKILP